MEDLDDRRKKGFAKLTPFGAVEEPVSHHAAAQTLDPPPVRALVYSFLCHATPFCHVAVMQTWDGASEHPLCCTECNGFRCVALLRGLLPKVFLRAGMCSSICIILLWLQTFCIICCFDCILQGLS